MSDHDATHAYRGYRLQALYVLNRILDSSSDLVFTPERIEDLSIYKDDEIIEIVQVKSYDELVLSHLEPSNPESFFHRASKYLEEDVTCRVVIANIGAIGPELRKAWEGDETHRKNVKNKFKEKGFSDEEIERFFTHIQINSYDEDLLRKEVHKKITNLLIGIDPLYAFDLLHKWLYEISEKRSIISQNDLIERMQGVGKFINDRIQRHSEWFTNIVPIAIDPSNNISYSKLRDEFFAGVAARFEHIDAGLDFLRPSKMEEIKEGYSNTNIVIVHGASGQGKTTLAYRYLYDNYPEQLRYQIKIVEDRNHALKVTSALSGYAEALGTSIIVYFDVSPRDNDWIELIVQLADNPFIQILVTVREEDYRRVNHNIPHHLRYSSVSLDLSKEEAKQLYQRAKESDILIEFLSFEDAWETFDSGGGRPLLEFVYLLTQTETLLQRLKKQIQRIKNKVREKSLISDELELLKLTAVITAYEGKLYLPLVKEYLNLPELSTTLHNYEEEYLLRVSDDEKYIEALHPIRSNILMDLLIDTGIESWTTIAQKALPLTFEGDWEIFLKKAYTNRHNELDQLQSITMDLFPKTWVGIGGVLRCLLWIGVKKYIDRNQEVIIRAKDIMGEAITWMILDLNFGGNFVKSLDDWWETLSDKLIPRERKDEIKEIRKMQTPKDEVFDLANKWLENQAAPSEQPKTAQDWLNTSELLYWSYRFNLTNEVGAWLSDESIIKSLKTLDLRNFSSVLFALFIIEPSRYETILENIRNDLILRLARDYKIFVLEDYRDSLVIHFLTYPEDSEISNVDEETNKIHSGTLARIEIVRKLFPKYNKYGSKGYGHIISGMENIPDESIKTGIPADNFPPNWPVSLNSLSTEMIQNMVRMETWAEYIDSLLDIRQKVLSDLLRLKENLYKYFQKDKAYNFLEKSPFKTKEWDLTKKYISNLPLLPRASVKSSSTLQEKYKDYKKSEREFFNKLSSFYDQALHVAVLNIRCGKEPANSPQKKAIIADIESQGVNLQNQFLSKINIWEALNSLSLFQTNFRNLFSEKIKSQTLEELEKQETEILEALVWTWIIFVDSPRSPFVRPEKQIPQRIRNQISVISDGIEKTLSHSEFNFGETCLLENIHKWDNQSTTWLQLDMESPLEYYTKIEKLIYALRDSLGASQYGDQLYSLADFYFKFIVIVPTVKGKLINKSIFPLQTNLAILQPNVIEDKPYLYFPKEVSSELLSELGSQVWNDENILNVNEFESAFNVVYLQLSLLGQLAEMPEFLDELIPEIQSYMKVRSEELSVNMQLLIDSASKVLDYLNNLPEKVLEENPLLVEVMQGMIKLNEILQLEDEVLKLSLKEINSFVEDLKELSPVISGIKLICLDQIIH